MQDLLAALCDLLRPIIREEVRRELSGGVVPVEPVDLPERVAIRAWLASLPVDGSTHRARDLFPRFQASEHAAPGLTLMGFGRFLTRERGRLVDVTRDRTGTHLYRSRSTAAALDAE